MRCSCARSCSSPLAPPWSPSALARTSTARTPSPPAAFPGGTWPRRQPAVPDRGPNHRDALHHREDQPNAVPPVRDLDGLDIDGNGACSGGSWVWRSHSRSEAATDQTPAIEGAEKATGHATAASRSRVSNRDASAAPASRPRLIHRRVSTLAGSSASASRTAAVKTLFR